MTEYTVIEDYAYFEVCVNITDGTLERNVEVQLYSMDGTAEGNPQKRHTLYPLVWNLKWQHHCT